MPSAEQLMNEINKLMGGTVLRPGSDSRFEVTYQTTGLLPIDIVLGGGLPRGRFVSIHGPYSTLKSYIGLKAIAEVQKVGGLAALIDTEHAFDPMWATELGVDISKLIVWPVVPEGDESADEFTGEAAIDTAEVLIRNRVDLIVFDSVAATLPQTEAGKRLAKESIQPARLAALMSVACRRLTAPNSRTAVLWINQLREQVGVTFGNPEKATGGRSLGYYSSLIMSIRAAGKITKEKKTFTGDKYTSSKVQVGQTFKATVEKSKLSKPWSEVFFDFDMQTGQLDMAKFLFAQGVELGLISKKGNTWEMATGIGFVRAVGKEAFLKKLVEDKCGGRMLEFLEIEIRKHHGLPLLPGKLGRAKKKGDVSKKRSSAKKAQGSTRVQDRGGSGSTAARGKKLLK